MNATNKPTSNPCVQKHILKPCSLLTRWSPRVVLGTWNQPHVGYKTFNVWFQKKRFGQENGEKCGRSAPYSSRQPLWVTIIKVPLPTPPLGWARVYPYSLQPSHLLMEACVYRSVQHKPLIFPGTPKRVGVWSHLSSSFFFVCLEWMIAAEFVTYVATEDKTPPGSQVSTWIIHGGAKYVYSLHKKECEKPFFKLGLAVPVCLCVVFIRWHFFLSFQKNRPLLYRDASFSEGGMIHCVLYLSPCHVWEETY